MNRLWVRSLIGGLLWGIIMFAVVPTGPRTVMTAVVCLCCGLLFGTALGVGVDRQQRRLFRDADGRPLSDAERVAVARAVAYGEPPSDARLREAATLLARKQRRPQTHPAVLIAICGFFTLLGVYVALTRSPWWWPAVTVWPVVGWLSIRADRRQGAAAVRYLRQDGTRAE